MDVSVVVCSHTVEMFEHIQDAATAVLEQSYDAIELVLVSDGDDALFSAMQAEYGDREDVRIAANDENCGLSHSRNRGIEQSSGDVVAFLDDDAVPESDWIEELVDGYERHDAIAVGGRVDAIWIAERPPFLPEEFFWLIGLTHRGFPEEECIVRNTNGSNMSFKRSVLEELDGFDEELGRKGESQVQGEETELAARMWSAYGEGMWYVPDATVGHKIFPYRTEFSWLVNRAFLQGYSKYLMARLVPETGGTETAFLRSLLTEFLPKRVAGLLRRPRMEKALQIGGIIVFTAAVGAGYLYGIAKSIVNSTRVPYSRRSGP